jgi:hypothetical protein
VSDEKYGIGIVRIAQERIKQIEDFGFQMDVDAMQVDSLMQAAQAYLNEAVHVEKQIAQGTGPYGVILHADPLGGWPSGWNNLDGTPQLWRPSANPADNLRKAGALIAAAMDGLAYAKGELNA